MDSITGLFYGLGIALQPQNILFCFLGCFVGTLIGVLPGLGPGGALALLLPVTFALPPATAIIMLSGIYYGAMYGGSTTSILINIPGEAASVVTCLDGYQMARKGRAGPALGMAAIASFIAGTISLFGLLFLAPPFANFALKFSSPEYVSLIICGLILVSFLGAGSKLKAFMMGTLGLLLGTIGTDPIEGIERFSFGIPYLMDGVGLIPVIMGLFGISEILINLEEEAFVGILTEKIKNLFPHLERLERFGLADRAGDRARVLHRRHPGGKYRHLQHDVVCPGKKDLQTPGKIRHRGHRRGGRARNRRTTPDPPGPSFPCCPWGSRPIPPWRCCWPP